MCGLGAGGRGPVMFICERLPMLEGTRVYVGEVRGAQAAVRDERTTEPGSPPRSLQKGERDGREGSRHKASCSWLPSPLPGVRPSAAPAPAAGAHAPQRPRPAAVHGARTMPRGLRANASVILRQAWNWNLEVLDLDLERRRYCTLQLTQGHRVCVW